MTYFLCRTIYQTRGDIPIMISKNTNWGKRADRERKIYNSFYLRRIKRKNGWWKMTGDPYSNLRKLHNLQTSRQFICQKVKDCLKKEMIVLDAGGGEGFVSRHLLSLCTHLKPTVISYDLSDEAGVHGRKHGVQDLFFVAGDIQHLALQDQSVDLVLSIETIEHTRDLELFGKEVFRVLKPGAKIFLSTPNKESFSLWFNEVGMFFIYNFLVSLFALFRRNIKAYPIHPYRLYYEGKDGFERFLTFQKVKGVFTKTGFELEDTYFTQWAGESIFSIARVIRFPISWLKVVVKIIQYLEKVFRAWRFAKFFGFTQILVFTKPQS